MQRPALMRFALGVGALIVVTLTLTACGSGATQEQAKAPKSSAPKDSPIANETGWLAYQTGQGDFMTDEVHLVRVDGSRDHVIATNLPGRKGHPDFSRDGSRLAFDQTTDGAADQIYISKANGSDAKRVAHCKLPDCLSYWEPAWSPDGSRLAISTASGPLDEQTGPASLGLAIIDVKSEKVTQIVEHEGAQTQDHFARWSPDGKRLVFWRAKYEADGTVQQTAVFIVNIDGSGLRRLTPWNMLAGDPDWSPNGNLILFSTRPLFDFDTSGRSELYTMRPDGSGMHKLTSYGEDGPRATQPRWTPDGKAILYTRLPQAGSPRHIWGIDRTGHEDVPVLTAAPIYTHPILQREQKIK